MKRGFTLIELMVVLAIIAVLSGIGLMLFTEAQKTARDARRKQDLRSIQVALESYYRANSRYPCSTNDFSGVDVDWDTSFEGEWWIVDKADSNGKCIPGAVDSGLPFNNKYISGLPKDSKDTGKYPWESEKDYSYAYLSAEDLSSFQGCPKGSGQYYILVARLEKIDSEVQKPEDVKFCDGDSVIGYHQEIVLMGQDVANPNFDKLLILTSQE